MKDFASEIRMRDQDILVELINKDRYSELDDILKNDSELYFSPYILLFCWSANVGFPHSKNRFVTLYFELQLSNGSIFFTLNLSNKYAKITILHITNFISLPEMGTFLEEVYKRK